MYIKLYVTPKLVELFFPKPGIYQGSVCSAFFIMAFFFGLFQAVMPLIGWFAASRFSHLIEDYDHWIAFGLLAFLGGRMIKESFSNEDKRCFDPTKLKVVVTLAIATSIDALAIGISFAFVGINSFTSILSPIVIIGFTSFVISTLGSLVGDFVYCTEYKAFIRTERGLLF